MRGRKIKEKREQRIMEGKDYKKAAADIIRIVGKMRYNLIEL